MTTATLIWGALGLVLGVLHSFSLWRAAQRVPQARATILRLMLVAMVFVAGALLGRILPIAIGWICGFSITAAALYFRRAS